MIHILKKALRMPPHIFLKKVIRKIRRDTSSFFTKRKILQKERPIFSENTEGLFSLFSIKDMDLSGLNRDVCKFLVRRYMAHEFDLLGSGWTPWNYKAEGKSVEGFSFKDTAGFTIDQKGKFLEKLLLPAHVKKAKKVWRYISKDYIPIDWQKDIKSGFRWDVKKWHLDQPIGRPMGSDIKVPWELSRLQHLPQLAIFAHFFPEEKDQILREIKDQLLDFIATNPYKMGANWVCPMDVGIRAANIAMTIDLIKGLGNSHTINTSFESIIVSSLLEHGEFIYNNLEYSEELTSNHYLSDIIGLLFIGAYLPSSHPQSNLYLSYGIQEFSKELLKQVNEDGTNFEASTCYHRLVGELFCYGAALIMGLPQERIVELKMQESIIHPLVGPRLQLPISLNFKDELIRKMGYFTLAATKPTFEVPQIGDNDSGRFMKLSPVGEMVSIESYKKGYQHSPTLKKPEQFLFKENVLDHRSFISALNGLFEDDSFTEAATYFPLEKSLIRALSNHKIKPRDRKIPRAPSNIKKKKTFLKPDKNVYVTRLKFLKTEGSLLDELKSFAFTNSGFYIFTSPCFHLFISCGLNGQNNNGGHGHNDKLSFELHVQNKDLVVDPGTYLYTPIPNERNRFRSTRNHSTPILEDTEQNAFERESLFCLKDEAKAECLRFGKDIFIGQHRGFGFPVVREIQIREKEIIITDYSEQPLKINFNVPQNYQDYMIIEGEDHTTLTHLYSRGYGLKEDPFIV